MTDLRPAPLPPVGTGWRTQARVWAWRLRFPVAAALVALALLTAVSTLRPDPAGSVRVVVTARDVSAGHTLTSGDVRYATVPSGVAPTGSRTSLDDVVGRAVAIDLPAGVALAGTLLGTPHGPAGTVVTTVRLAEPQMAALLSPGDRVDVLAAAADGGPGTVVARGAVVLPSPAPDSTDTGLFGACGTTQSPTVVLAVSPTEMPALSAAASALLTAFVVP
ncbi:MAG: SAF domain-containing protein [Micrococcales bacterium]|nr:SAF domain-containing protein [Micrococcales bacterium]